MNSTKIERNKNTIVAGYIIILEWSSLENNAQFEGRADGNGSGIERDNHEKALSIWKLLQVGGRSILLGNVQIIIPPQC